MWGHVYALYSSSCMVEIEPATVVNKNMNMNVHRDRIRIVRLIPKGEQQSIYRRVIQNINSYAIPIGYSCCCGNAVSRTFGTLRVWNDMKWSAHGVLEQCLVYYICAQPCITISFISYSHTMINRIMICCYCISKYAFATFSLVDFSQP